MTSSKQPNNDTRGSDARRSLANLPIALSVADSSQQTGVPGDADGGGRKLRAGQHRPYGGGLWRPDISCGGLF